MTLESAGLGDEHLGITFSAGSLPIASPATLGDIVALLEQTYCGHSGVEFVHITNLDQRQWIQRRVEQSRGKPNFSQEQQRHILQRLVDSDAFESFLAMRYVGKKRFGLEGADTIIPMLDQLILEFGRWIHVGAPRPGTSARRQHPQGLGQVVAPEHELALAARRGSPAA